MLNVLTQVSPIAPRGVLAEMAFVEQVLGEGLNGEHLVHGILVLDSAIGVWIRPWVQDGFGVG